MKYSKYLNRRVRVTWLDEPHPCEGVLVEVYGNCVKLRTARGGFICGVVENLEVI